jgi:hypothetical protein
MPDIASWFEAAMLVCFGASWPVSILKTWRARTVRGKSLIFLLLILVGYISGILAKCLTAWSAPTAIPWVTWLYALNAAMVFVDIGSYLYLRKITEA